MTEPGPQAQGPWAASLQGGDAGSATPLPPQQQQQHVPLQQQQLVQQPGIEAMPVPNIAADPTHLDRVTLPQSAAMYQAPLVAMAAQAQQFAPQGEVPYATDAYQAVMGTAPLMQAQQGADGQPQMTSEVVQQMQLIAQLQQQQAAAAAAAAGGAPLQQQPGQQQAMDSPYVGTPANQAPIRPGEFAYEPQAPKTVVTQEALENQQAKACRLCGVAKMLEEFHVNNSNADKHDTRCKACCAQYEKEKRAKKTRVLEPTVAEKECRSCHETKQASEFYRYTYSKDGLYQQCKACHAHAGEARLAKQGGGDSDGGPKPPVESKVCSKCNEEKPKSEYYASKYLSSGLHSQCKRCVRSGQEKRVRCPPEQAVPEKTCRKCRTTKKQEEFYFNNLVEDGLTTYCRTCHNDKGSPAPGPDGSVPVRSGTRYNVAQPTKSEKHCKKCDTVKPAEEFYHIKSSSDGLASNCKACAVQIANSTRKHFVPEPTVEHKVCKACGLDKTASEFYRNRTNADGLFGKCKLCSDSQAESNRKPRVRHNIQEPTVEQKVCTKCNDLKPAGDFNRDKTKADGLQFRCKACVHDYMKRRRRTENVRKREELEAERLAHEPDNLAVLAQAAEPGAPNGATAMAAQLGLAPGQPLPPAALQQLQRLTGQSLVGTAPAPQAMGMLQQQPGSYAAADEQPPQQAVLAQQMQELAAMRQGILGPADGGAAAEPLHQQQQHPQAPEQQHHTQQTGSPVFMSNDDDMNITVDVNELQQAAASTPS